MEVELGAATRRSSVSILDWFKKDKEPEAPSPDGTAQKNDRPPNLADWLENPPPATNPEPRSLADRVMRTKDALVTLASNYETAPASCPLCRAFTEEETNALTQQERDKLYHHKLDHSFKWLNREQEKQREKEVDDPYLALFSKRANAVLTNTLAPASTPSPFILRDKNEEQVWNFETVWLAREVTTTRRVGERAGLYGGPSIRIASGLWWRVGASRGNSESHNVSQTGLAKTDTGKVLLSTTAIYFGGGHSSFRVPYSTIIRLQEYTDGFGVFQNGGKEIVFVLQNVGKYPEDVAKTAFEILGKLARGK
jgi:hypothetical protein